MAKPLPVASSDISTASTSASCISQDLGKPSHSPRHRSHRKFRHPGSHFVPSSGILFFLASLASSTPTANGSPTPPSFLCPSIDIAGDKIESFLNVASSSSIPAPNPVQSTTTSQSTNALSPRHVPDKFEKGIDGVWRRAGTYTLYGSTVSLCDGTSSCRQPTDAVSAVDDQIQVGNQIASNGSIPSYDIRDSLPPGWKPVAKPYESRTPLILAMSLVLACLICFFIFGCLFWRRTMKRHYKGHDLEAKAKRKRRANLDEDAQDLVSDKEIKVKQKIWARATARWKANVRLSARQRRGKRLGNRTSQVQQSNISLDYPQSHLTDSHVSNHSATSSRNSSTVSLPNQLQEEQIQPVGSTAEDVATPSTPTFPTSRLSLSALPPAYQHRSQIPPIIVSSEEASEMANSPAFGPSRRPSHSSIYTTSVNTIDSQVPDGSPLHSAHLATDDKSLLARLQGFASAPPDNSSDPGETSHAQVSAPVWHDADDMEEIPPHLMIPTSSSEVNKSLSPMFPSPPSKERLAAAEFYHYPYAFDEVGTLEDSEPSAPPFEENSLQDSHLLLPSAPPLLDDDSSMSHQASAPELDLSTPMESHEENVSGQNHDRIQLTLQEEPTSSSTVSVVPVPTSTSTNDITLPGYRP